MRSSSPNTDGLFAGTTDAFVEVVSPAGALRTTTTVNNDRSPHFNQAFSFLEEASAAPMSFHVYDKGTFGGKTLIGVAQARCPVEEGACARTLQVGGGALDVSMRWVGVADAATSSLLEERVAMSSGTGADWASGGCDFDGGKLCNGWAIKTQGEDKYGFQVKKGGTPSKDTGPENGSPKGGKR